MTIELHYLLTRQLNRLGLSFDSVPEADAWQAFIMRINSSYIENDKDRYLVERSLEISSRELLDLNTKLEEAQHIALVGHWFQNLVTNTTSWSKEAHFLLGFAPAESVPTLDQIVHKDDLKKLQDAMNQSLTEAKDYEIEIRLWHKSLNQYRWFNCIGHHSGCNGHENKMLELSGTVMDITRRKETEQKIIELNEKLVDSARSIGMAEVATVVLHNIGNVLNSINVSITILQEKLRDSELDKFKKLAILIQDHITTLHSYLTEDPKGKLIPEFLLALSEKMDEVVALINYEINNVNVNIGHIKDIIVTQQSLAGVFSVVEQVSLVDMIESAYQISGAGLEAGGIVVKKIYEDIPIIMVNKSKLLQILVNFIQNAKEALLASSGLNKQLDIKIRAIQNNQVEIEVKDNGVGIKKEDLTRIFSFGFTTKKQGHGFGLHSCALATKEMNGSLNVSSLGQGRGAIFTLTLPIDGSDKA